MAAVEKEAPSSACTHRPHHRSRPPSLQPSPITAASAGWDSPTLCVAAISSPLTGKSRKLAAAQR